MEKHERTATIHARTLVTQFIEGLEPGTVFKVRSAFDYISKAGNQTSSGTVSALLGEAVTAGSLAKNSHYSYVKPMPEPEFKLQALEASPMVLTMDQQMDNLEYAMRCIQSQMSNLNDGTQKIINLLDALCDCLKVTA